MDGARITITNVVYIWFCNAGPAALLPAYTPLSKAKPPIFGRGKELVLGIVLLATIILLGVIYFETRGESPR